MATISSAGIGSGLDVESLVTKLVSLERTPITQLATRTDGLKTELSSFGKVQSALSTLRDAAAKLTNPTTWAGTLATSSDATAVTASATDGAAIGNVSVQIDKLAQAQTLVSSKTYTGPTATVGSGTLTIQLGTWATDTAGDVTGFTDKPDTAAAKPGDLRAAADKAAARASANADQPQATSALQAGHDQPAAAALEARASPAGARAPWCRAWRRRSRRPWPWRSRTSPPS